MTVINSVKHKVEYVRKTSVNLATYMCINGVDVKLIYDDGMIIYSWVKDDNTWNLYQKYLNDETLQNFIRTFKEIKMKGIELKNNMERND